MNVLACYGFSIVFVINRYFFVRIKNRCWGLNDLAWKICMSDSPLLWKFGGSSFCIFFYFGNKNNRGFIIHVFVGACG